MGCYDNKDDFLDWGIRNSEFDESKHPRGDDGKFGKGSGKEKDKSSFKVKKESSGYYRIEKGNQSFQAEKNEDNGTWNLNLIEKFSEQQGGGEGSKYMDTFETLKEIKDFIKELSSDEKKKETMKNIMNAFDESKIKRDSDGKFGSGGGSGGKLSKSADDIKTRKIDGTRLQRGVYSAFKDGKISATIFQHMDDNGMWRIAEGDGTKGKKIAEFKTLTAAKEYLTGKEKEKKKTTREEPEKNPDEISESKRKYLKILSVQRAESKFERGEISEKEFEFVKDLKKQNTLDLFHEKKNTIGKQRYGS